MSFTFVGILQVLVGFVLLFRSLGAMLVFLMVSGLLGGSAALTVPALGNSSIPPIQFALVFVYLRILMPRGGCFAVWTQGVRDNFLLVLFTLYGVIAAFAAPRIFAGQMQVAPMRFENARGLFDTVPLQPTAQNVTAAVYLLGALLATLAVYAIVRMRGGLEALVKGAVAVGWIHALSGVIAAQAKGTPLGSVFALLRNGTYAQLDQSYQGFTRIDGFFPEASAWSSFAFAWFVFTCECWYRSVWARQTGLVALALGGTLFASTSSTAYVGLACYGSFFLARALLLPGSAEPLRLRQAGIAFAGMALLAAIALAAWPGFAADVREMILHMTVEKGGSLSGRQRLFWAMQGVEAFSVSGGLGIGPGSFRSSSLFTAILGTMGVVGMVTFCGYMVQVMRSMDAGGQGRDAVSAVMAACATTAPIILLPAAISSPNSHPGTNFAIFAGAALALRAMLPHRRPARPGASALLVSRSVITGPLPDEASHPTGA